MSNRKIAVYGIIMASYTVLSLLVGAFSFGLMQIRIAELLMVLVLEDGEYILPLSLGCFLANMIGVLCGMNAMVIDILVGTIATYISGVLVYMFRHIRLCNKPILSLLMPPIVNGLLVGLELHFVLDIGFMMAFGYVFAGEFVAVTILGSILGDGLCRVIENFKK